MNSRGRLFFGILGLVALLVACGIRADEGGGCRLGTWTEAREDTPDVIFVHRHGHVTEVTRVPGTGEDGIPLQLQGPSEVSMKWFPPVTPGEEPWPPGITVLEVTGLCDDVQLVRVAENAQAAADELAAMPEVLYAYPVEFTEPLFSRILPTDRLIVRLKAGVTIDQVVAGFPVEEVAVMMGSDVEYVMRLLDPKAGTPTEMVVQLEASGLVEWAQRDGLRDAEFFYMPTDPQFGAQWHMNATGQMIGAMTAPNNLDVNAPEAWNTTRGNPAIKIAVIDDAIETTHPDLALNLTTNGAYDFFSNDTNPNPDTPNDMHGTPCAGIVGAVEGNGVGVAGMAHQCPIVPIKICSNGWLPYDSQVANSVRHAAMYADIITCSWGYVNPAPSTLSSVRYALQSGAGGRGSVVFFATGNDAGFVPHVVTFSGAGAYNVRWRYTKDAAISAGLDRCFVDSVWYANGGSEFFDGLVPPALPAGYASSGGTWTSLAEFLGARAESSAQFIGSPAIGHTQSTYVAFSTTSPAPGSQLWYYMRVDAQPTTYVTNTATVYDYGQVEYQPTGSPTWTTGNVLGGQPSIITYPAADPETIAVGACDTVGRRSHYSQWGPALDFVAPSDGEWLKLGIQTTDLTGGNGYDAGNYCQADQASKFGGTSAACPLAAGIGALVRSVNANLSPAQVRNILRSTCINLDTNWYTYTGRMGGRCAQMGWGQVDANAAVAAAQATPDVMVVANDLVITEVSPLDGVCPFVEVYNQSMGQAHLLENLMLTDCATGGDIGESACQFPVGAMIPPQGTIVIALGQATAPFITELNTVLAGGAMPGGLQLFECIGSGLQFNGLPIPILQPHTGLVGIMLSASDNIALVFTPGMAASYLPDVIDGMAFGAPVIGGGFAIGVAPRTPEMVTFASGATATLSYHRDGTIDTNDSQPDFPAMPRSPGRIVFGLPVQSLTAAPLTSAEIELLCVPANPPDTVMIVASVDPVFSYPTHGLPYPPGTPLGLDMVIHVGPSVPQLLDGPYPPMTPMYYRAWNVDPVNNYSVGVSDNAATLAPPTPLPVGDTFPSPVLNTVIWPYAPGVTIDAGLAIGPPTPPYCALLDSSPGNDVLASLSIDASSTTNVQVQYAFQEAGAGDPPEPGEDLWVECLDPARTWQALAVHASGAPGPFLPNVVQVPPAFLHNEFRVRFRTTAVNMAPGDLDNWFVDDVVVEEFAVLAGFSLGSVPSPQSVGVPFQVVVTALSSMGGPFSNYAGAAELKLSESVAYSPTVASPFVDGVWSDPPMLITEEPATQLWVIAGTNGLWTTGTVFEVLIDADLDTIDDSWEYGWFQDLGVADDSPGSDQDSDRFSDLSEFVAGTCPTNPSSWLQVTVPLVSASGASNVLEWASVSGRWYHVDRSVDLTNGFPTCLVSNLVAVPPTNRYSDTTPPTNGPVFYRLRVKR